MEYSFNKEEISKKYHKIQDKLLDLFKTSFEDYKETLSRTSEQKMIKIA